MKLNQDLGLLFLRLSVGGLMMGSHGIPKIMRFAEIAEKFPDPIGLGASTSLVLVIFAEVFCSAAVILGAFTRLACIPLIITMAVAALVIHAEDPFQKKEFALMYLIPFLTLLFTGSGKFSLEHRLLPH